jgi:hypothetical protein
MAQTLGQTIIIENVVGAGGTTATTRAARAANDGYTLITGIWARMRLPCRSIPSSPTIRRRISSRRLLAGTPILILARKDSAAKGPQGIHRLRQGEREQGQRGACRRRLGLERIVRAVELGPRRQADRRSLQRHRTGDERAGGGQVDYMCDQIVNAVPQINGGTIKAMPWRRRSAIRRCPMFPPPPSRPAGLPGAGVECDFRSRRERLRTSSA